VFLLKDTTARIWDEEKFSLVSNAGIIMRIKGLSHALVSRRFEAEGNLWLVKFMFPSREESKQKGRPWKGKERARNS
jgi:hypothetical protein